ncbi:MAG: type II toxin-antitoxin system VapC family toxin [Gammaproteobacteria bacterium]|nr:type II toxin-antitoxin system VapC family toxin [Gammaproteobacteria bacterium]
MILLDTHVLLWSRVGVRRTGPRCMRLVEQALRDATLAASAISFWEVAMLREKGRIDLSQDIRAWRMRLINDGLIEIPVDGDIAMRANELTGLHADPADRLIVATALGGHTLVTADERILSWSRRLSRMDARE